MAVTLRTRTQSGATTKGSRLTHEELDDNFLLVPSGTGAVQSTVQTALQLVVHTSQYDSQANYEAARDALTGTLGVNNLDVSGTISVSGNAAITATLPVLTLNCGVGQITRFAFQENSVVLWQLIGNNDDLSLFRGAAEIENLRFAQTTGVANLSNKVFPGTDAAAIQSVAGLYAGNGLPNNANGSDGDIYFRGDGGAFTTIYQRRAGAWVGII